MKPDEIKMSEHRRAETDSLDDLRASLQGHVFHVTKLASLAEILAAGEIRPNHDRSLPATFGYLENGFFRNRGCVSLFDYRAAPTEKLEEFRGRCSPFQAASPDAGGVAVLFLKPIVYEALVPWTRWQDERAWGEMVVPHVEAGYPGPIRLELVSEIMTLELTEDPDSPLAIFRRARARRLARREPDEANSR